MALDVNIASLLLEQIQDQHLRPTARFCPEDCSSYSTIMHVGRREVRKWVESYIFHVEGEGDIRVDICEGKIVKWLCGGSTRALTFIARRIGL